MELPEVITGCVNGDRKCQQIIYQKLYGKMMGICMRYSKDRDEALDVLQDGFIKVFGKIGQYGNDGPFEVWVARIMRNTAIDKLRKNKKFVRYVEEDYANESEEFVDDGNANEAAVEEYELNYPNISKEEILGEVQRLSPACRAVFNMHIVDGIPHSEIANQLGINIGTSKSNLHKAKNKLRKKLHKHISELV